MVVDILKGDVICDPFFVRIVVMVAPLPGVPVAVSPVGCAGDIFWEVCVLSGGDWGISGFRDLKAKGRHCFFSRGGSLRLRRMLCR